MYSLHPVSVEPLKRISDFSNSSVAPIANFKIWQLQILRAEAKKQGSRTNMGQEDSSALTGIAH